LRQTLHQDILASLNAGAAGKIVVVVTFSRNRTRIELHTKSRNKHPGAAMRICDVRVVLLSSFVPRYYVCSVEDE
jgi:hypothetical protein